MIVSSLLYVFVNNPDLTLIPKSAIDMFHLQREIMDTTENISNTNNDNDYNNDIIEIEETNVSNNTSEINNNN